MTDNPFVFTDEGLVVDLWDVGNEECLRTMGMTYEEWSDWMMTR